MYNLVFEKMKRWGRRSSDWTASADRRDARQKAKAAKTEMKRQRKTLLPPVSSPKCCHKLLASVCQPGSTSQTYISYTRERVCIIHGRSQFKISRLPWPLAQKRKSGNRRVWRRERAGNRTTTTTTKTKPILNVRKIFCWEFTMILQFGRAWTSLYSANSYLCVPACVHTHIPTGCPSLPPLPLGFPVSFQWSLPSFPPSILLSRKGNPSCS